MNDYMKLIAHAAAKFTGRPAVLSPSLDSYCGWENKKSRFCSEPIKEDYRVVLSAGGLSFKELQISLELKPDKGDYEGCLKICMQHGHKKLGENNFGWCRDCTYEYAISTSTALLVPRFAAYWTDDDFLVIQARNILCPFIEGSDTESILKFNPITEAFDKDGHHKFRLIPIEVIDVLEPALNVPFLKQIVKATVKKSTHVCSYISAATEVPEANDVLSLLKCIPLRKIKKMDFDLEQLRQDAEEAAAGQGSQAES